MINTWTMRSVTVALAGLALVVGASRSQGQELKDEAAKGGSAIVLAENGLTAYAIVTGAQPLLAEQTAGKELAEYLKKVTGAEFKAVAETTAEKPAKAIYLGWTAFAASKGIDCAKLGPEESVIRTVGDDLIIVGGRTRGTLYGVYDFLQKELGVYWLDRDTEVVPKRPTLPLNAMDRRAMPALHIRNLYTSFLEQQWSKSRPLAYDKETIEKERRFRVRNLQNGFDYGGSEMRPYGGGEYIGHIYHGCHNFGFYVPAEKYFAQHPEYYAQDKDGKRLPTSDHLSGSICLTHPEVRKIALANLLEVIAADRKEFPPGKPVSADQPPPTLYDVSQQDNGTVCHCPACRTLAARRRS